MVTIMNRTKILFRRIRWLTGLFMLGLFLSGVTAIPLTGEVNGLAHWLGPAGGASVLAQWLGRVREALGQTQAAYPFLFYGTDWLAFAHLAIAVAFIGPYIDPVRNKWVITFGLIACVGVIPLALIAGQVRGIPLPWRLIDCSFGIVGSVPLLLCRRSIRTLERQRD